MLAPEAFLFRFATGTGHDRLLVVNFGKEIEISGIAEPLLAPVKGHRWETLFSTEDYRYGGGRVPPVAVGCMCIPGHSALVLASMKEEWE